jgi:hypothetical protein
MKISLLAKLLFLVASGVLLGEITHAGYTHWNRLGRDAFLSYQTHRFDLYMSSPRSALLSCAVFVIFTIGFGALYEATGFAAEKIFASSKRGSTANHSTSNS